MKKRNLFVSALCASLAIVAAGAGYQALRYRQLALDAQAERDDLARKSIDARAIQQKLANEQAENRQIRESFVRIKTGTPWDNDLQASRDIRDYVYRTNIEGSSRPAYRGLDIFSNLGRPGYEQLCGGMSVAYAWALDSLGIPAMIVQLAAQTYLDGAQKGDTHVTVEAFVDGAWRISDPTFNVELQCSDNTDWLDTEGARQCVARGERLVPFPGKTQIDGRTLADYYAPFEIFLAAYTVTPYDGELLSAPRNAHPYSDWLVDAAKKYE